MAEIINETRPVMIELIARATDEDLAQIRELGNRYGTPFFGEVVRYAVRDALAHFDCQKRRKPLAPRKKRQ